MRSLAFLFCLALPLAAQQGPVNLNSKTAVPEQRLRAGLATTV